jgi:hypothetical protein
MVKVDAAVLGRTIKSTAASLTASADLLQDCLDEGMAWTVLGSVECSRSHRGGAPSNSKELRCRENTHCGLIVVIRREEHITKKQTRTPKRLQERKKAN